MHAETCLSTRSVTTMSNTKFGKITPTKCWHCLTEVSQAAYVGETVGPRPNQLAFCMDCGAIAIFDDALQLRKPNEDETTCILSSELIRMKSVIVNEAIWKRRYPEPRLPRIAVCWSCRLETDTSLATGELTPKAADVSLCMHCGAPNMFTEDLRWRKPTPEEFVSLLSDPDVVRLGALVNRTITRRRQEEARAN
jgi:hypothetical protein